MLALAVLLAVLLAASSARAEEHPRTWRAEASVRYVVLGNVNPTGGLAPQLAGGRTWAFGAWEAGVGGEALAFGFGGAPRWYGVLAGPTAHASWGCAPGAACIPLRFGLDIGLDIGRLPVCNDWPAGTLCLRFWGLYPRASVEVAYEVSPGLAAVASFSGRAIRTLAWSGPSWEPTLGLRLSR